jgi:hypothetical protein
MGVRTTMHDPFANEFAPAGDAWLQERTLFAIPFANEFAPTATVWLRPGAWLSVRPGTRFGYHSGFARLEMIDP